MNNNNYIEIISELNFRKVWIPRRIIFTITSEQYIALLKGYQPHWDMRYGVIYDYQEDYFYTYRSGYVVGKYKLEKQRNDDYIFTEMYQNPFKVDYMEIFDCVIEACKQNKVTLNREELIEYISETRRLNESNERQQTFDIGPQSPSDNPFTAKARKLQSLWRVQNGLEMGVGPTKNSKDKITGNPTYYGNMINDGEINGRNFYFPETFAYAQWRVGKKLKDETIDEYRLFNNLMSSMPMAFNLFHPLMMLKTKEPSILDEMIKAAFPKIKSIYKVLEIGLEFIPTPIENYTGDKSAMDAFIRFQNKAGNNYLIAIETKYTDSLGINTASDKSFQKQLDIIRELDMFIPASVELIRKKELAISQIYRNFILAEKYAKLHGLDGVYSVILAPGDHPTTKEEVKSLQYHLKDEYKYKITALALEDFTMAIQEHCPPDFQEWMIWFRNRYKVLQVAQ